MPVAPEGDARVSDKPGAGAREAPAGEMDLVERGGGLVRHVRVTGEDRLAGPATRAGDDPVVAAAAERFRFEERGCACTRGRGRGRSPGSGAGATRSRLAANRRQRTAPDV